MTQQKDKATTQAESPASENESAADWVLIVEVASTTVEDDRTEVRAHDHEQGMGSLVADLFRDRPHGHKEHFIERSVRKLVSEFRSVGPLAELQSLLAAGGVPLTYSNLRGLCVFARETELIAGWPDELDSRFLSASDTVGIADLAEDTVSPWADFAPSGPESSAHRGLVRSGTNLDYLVRSPDSFRRS